MEIQNHPTKMSQGENDSDLTSFILKKINEGAQKAEFFFSSSGIWRVPKMLKRKKSPYAPGLIAIGPLHRKDKHLPPHLQLVKKSYTSSLLDRLTAGMENQRELADLMKFMVVKKCLAEIKTLRDDAKKCYVEEVTLDYEMMLIDGCFILELLCRSRTHLGTPKGQKYADPISDSKISYFLKHDLLLLENQIPFFVLEKLFRLTMAQICIGTPYKNWPLSRHVWYFFSNLNLAERRSTISTSSGKTFLCSPNDFVLGVFGSTIAAAASDCVLTIFGSTAAAAAEEGEEEEEVQSGGNIHPGNAEYTYHHILHYIHDSYLPCDQPETRNHSPCATNIRMPSASELVYAGVKFVAGPSNKLFNVQFTEPKGLFWWYHRACFEISPIKVDDRTESLLKNLIAFEQYCPRISEHFSSYATIMDMLVNTDKDIQVLEEAGVVINYLGSSKEATDVFNDLCKEIMLGHDFVDACIRADKYSKHFWPRNMAHVRGTYFKSPCTFIAFCVGFIVFVMSLVGFVRDFLKK